MKEHNHPSHEEELAKINRVLGQVEALKRMIGERKYCVDIMIQTKAARTALKSVELSILARHMRNCLYQVSHEETSNATRDNQISEILALLKKYE